MSIEEEVGSVAARLPQLDTGIRIFAVAGVIILGFFNLLLAFAVPKFDLIFRDMLGGRPLPGLTEFVIQNRSTAFAVGVLLPLAAIVLACLLRSPLRALGTLAIIAVLTVAQLIVTWAAMFSPLLTVVQGMQGGGSP